MQRPFAGESTTNMNYLDAGWNYYWSSRSPWYSQNPAYIWMICCERIYSLFICLSAFSLSFESSTSCLPHQHKITLANKWGCLPFNVFRYFMVRSYCRSIELTSVLLDLKWLNLCFCGQWRLPQNGGVEQVSLSQSDCIRRSCGDIIG